MHWSEVVEWEQVTAHTKRAKVGCLIILKYETTREFVVSHTDLPYEEFMSNTLEEAVEHVLSTLVHTWDVDLETVLQLTNIQNKLKIGLLEF